MKKFMFLSGLAASVMVVVATSIAASVVNTMRKGV
jgi:hypothetical protein